MATTTGQVQLIASIDTKDYTKGVDTIEGANKRIENSADKTADNSNKALTSISRIGIAGIVTAAVAAGAAIISNIGSAISRVDTLSNSSRTFENLGFSASVVTSTVQALTRSIEGLPTPLNEAIQGVQLIASSTNDLSKSQKIYTALNNGILGFGGTAQDVAGAVLQLSQSFSSGRIDAQTYNSLLQNNLGPALAAIARQSGLTAAQLKEGLSDGSISVSSFQDALISLNENGGGGLKSLQQIAKDSTAGISTGFANFNTAVSRGIAAIITSIGAANIAGAISNIGSSFESSLKNVSNFVSFIIKYQDVFGPIAVGLSAIVIGFTAWAIAIKAVTVAQAILNAVQKASTIGLIIVGVVALIAALAYFFTQTETGRKVVQVVFKAIGDSIQFIGGVIGEVGKFFIKTWDEIAKVWGAVVGFFTMIGQGIALVFNSIVSFFREWGLTILAIIFLPFALLLGVVFLFKDQIIGFFTEIGQAISIVFTAIFNTISSIFTAAFNFIVAIFTPIVEFYILVFTAAWNAIASIFGIIGTWFADRWNEVVAVFSVVGQFFASVFATAWNNIKTIFGAVGGFFRGIFDTITGIFGGVGTAIGDTIGSAFRNVINDVLKFAVNMINGFIKAINVAIDIINNIPGVKIPVLGKLPIPQLAAGGIISSATLALVGEGREPEAVIPLSKLDAMLSRDSTGNNSSSNRQPSIYEINVTSQVGTDADARNLARRVVDAVTQIEKAKGA